MDTNEHECRRASVTERDWAESRSQQLRWTGVLRLVFDPAALLIFNHSRRFVCIRGLSLNANSYGTVVAVRRAARARSISSTRLWVSG